MEIFLHHWNRNQNSYMDNNTHIVAYVICYQGWLHIYISKKQTIKYTQAKNKQSNKSTYLDSSMYRLFHVSSTFLKRLEMAENNTLIKFAFVLLAPQVPWTPDIEDLSPFPIINIWNDPSKKFGKSVKKITD